MRNHNLASAQMQLYVPAVWVWWWPSLACVEAGTCKLGQLGLKCPLLAEAGAALSWRRKWPVGKTPVFQGWCRGFDQFCS